MGKQIIEVEYDKDLVEKYKENYIMEEEGTGDIESEPFDTQRNVNEISCEEMNEEGEVIIEEVVENDQEN